MRDYVMPRLGRKRVDHITTADVMSVLLPHWSAKCETMRRTKQRLSRIFRWSIAQGCRTDDPAGTALDAGLPRNGGKAQHYAALPHGEVAAATAAVRKSGAWPGTKAAFEFLVLTACRSGDVRLANWGEVNLKSGVWAIPADRAKTQREHDFRAYVSFPKEHRTKLHSVKPLDRLNGEAKRRTNVSGSGTQLSA